MLARVQHHPSRAHLIPALRNALRPLRVEVIRHESDPPSPWAGYLKCLERIPKQGHLLIVQDDVTLAPNFVPAVEQIAATHPDTPICLFLSRLPRDASVKAGHAMRQNRRYVNISWRGFLPVVALLWPVDKARDFREWVEQNPRLPGVRIGDPRSDDAMGGRWKMATRQTVLACVPSIVEHPDMVESTIGRTPQWGKDKNRVAAFLADDALDYDWSGP